MFNKKGVSLITVLMFMLVATIAATATFKYLTSENRSSASRMEIQEARQSAYAGIQSTRAWMTNNANDVGAIVRHYKSTGEPVLMNYHTMGKQNFDVWVTGITKEHGSYKFKILSEGKTRHGTKYTEAAILNVSGLYQVKIPIDSAKPKSIAYDYSYFGGSISNHGDAKLSSMLINGNWSGNPVGIDKNIIITGNAKLSGNKVDIYGTGCIGGNLYADNGVDAKNLYVHGTSYSFGGKTKGISNHAYFDGIVEQGDSKKIEVGGNLTVKNRFKTHMGNGTSKVVIKGNLCLDSTTSQIQIGGMQGDNPSFNVPFEVHGDVWASHPYAFYAKSGDFADNYKMLSLGKKESKLYIPDAYHLDEYNAMRDSKGFSLDNGRGGTYTYNPYVSVAAPTGILGPLGHVGPVNHEKYCFYVPDANDVTYVDGKFYVGGFEFPHDYHYGDGYATKLSPYCSQNDRNYGNLPKLHVSPWFMSEAKKENVSRESPVTPVACADSVKQVCYDIWEQKPGCDGAEFKVDDILKTAYDKFEPYASKGCAASITTVDDSENNDFSVKLNDCYSENFNDYTKRENNLYNGYLVVKVSYGNLKQGYRKKLKGHFIIILTNRPNETIVLPPTDGDAKDGNYVFLYLSEGAFQFQGKDDNTVHYNYFIYTKEDVGSSGYNYTSHELDSLQGGFLFNNAHFDGSVYAEVGTGSNNKCAKVSALTSNHPMVFNKELLESLTNSKVICDISVANCGGVAESSSSSSDGPASSSSNDDSVYDSYIVSIAPQLNVSLETQYIAMESISSSSAANYSASAIEPSVLIMPRIIYLTKTASGKLEDYYSVLTLNRKKDDPVEVKNPSNVVCDGFSQTTGKLYDGAELEAGNYKCLYNATTYSDTVPFYVVVSNVSGDVPVVLFQDPNDEKRLYLNDEGFVQVHVGPATNPGGGKIKFDVFIDNVDELSGWKIEPIVGVTARRDSSSGSRLYYSAEITPQVNAQDVSILKIKTDGSAVDGDMYIYLTPPTEQCQIGSDHPYHVYVYARAYISRNASLATYCAHNYEICNNTVIGDTTLYAHSQRDRCGAYNGRWMSVNGTSCSETDVNNSWVCLTNTDISPIEASSARNALKDTCEIIIPSENNIVSGPSGGDHYELYGALVRKKVKVNVKFENAANNSGSKVTIKDSKVDEEYYCENSNIDNENGCEIWVYTGVPIDFSYEARSEDNGNFVRWSCTGKGCPNSNTSYDDAPTFTFYDDGNPHNVTIVFKKDSHCYYDDFKDELINATTTAFCAAGVATCVDTCATTLVGSQACQPKLSRQPLANWLMIYHNVGSGSNAAYEVPIIDEEGFIYASAAQDKPSILLRNKDVGHNGRMFSLLQTGIVDASNTKDFLNSGFVVRSNGHEHLILNIYGKSTSGSLADLTFRVCKVSGQSIISESGGDCRLVTGGDPLSITNSTFVKVKLVVENNSLKVTAIIDRNGGQETWQGDLDISDFSEINDESHTYVGLSLADPDFRVYDNGWISSLYNDCGPLESPSVSCYFDEYVKPNEYVKPYVTIQSGNSFENRNCFRKFYYNGCDNSTNRTSCEGIGFPGEIGSEIDSVLGYSFTQLGKHGVDNNGKLTKSAFVKMICPGNVTSIDLANDASSCGKFTVGYQSYCTKDVTIYNDSKYISANEVFKFPETDSDEYMNMLGSELNIVVEMDGPLGANLTVQLEDANGVRSLSRTIDRTGATKISEWISSYTIDFDPQHVSKVIITSDASVSIDNLHIYTDCSNKLDLECKDASASFDFDNGHWTVNNVKVNDPDNVVCSVTAQSNNAPSSITGVVGCNNLVLPYESRDWLFDTDTSVTFTVRAAKPNPPEDSLIGDCKIEGIRNRIPDTISCRIEKSYIYIGNAAPNFQFTIGKSAGPSLQIPYKVTIGGKIITGMASTGVLQTINFPDDVSINAGTTYTYKVEVDLNISNLPPPCGGDTTSFLVKDVSDLPTITDCKVDENGRFEYSISNPNEMDYSYTIAATDAIRNPLKSETGTKDNLPSYFEYTPALKGTYAYSIALTREGLTVECNRPLKYPPDVNMSITCPSDITAQEPSDAIVLSDYAASPCETPFSCEYKVIDNAENVDKSFSGGSFYDVNASGEKTYRLEASISKSGTSIYDTTLSCTFNVSFLGELAVSCPTEDVTNQKPDNISVNVGVSNCDGCTYLIDAITPSQSGSKFTFSDSDVSSDTESKKYTFKAVDKYSRSKTCEFNVVFASGGGCKCTDYCTQSQCDKLRVSGSLRFDGNCYFATSISYMNGTEYKVNGTSFKDYKNSGFGEPVDGGYYIVGTGADYGNSVTLGKPTPGCSSYYTCTKKTCIPFVNGTGGYDKNCYSSGLANHANGTCYALQDGRADAQNINNSATDTYWWKVVDCNDFCI